MSDWLTRVIRNVVSQGWGVAAVWLAVYLGAEFDAETSALICSAVTALLVAVVAGLSRKVPWLEWLLGVNKRVVYLSPENPHDR
jgi:uncharacterized protein YsxB (DUF464 family)